MPGNPPSVDTEGESLVAYLRQQRDGLKNAAYGLTEERIRLRPTASALTVGGLIKQAASIELGWTQTMIGNPDHSTAQAYFDSFSLTDSTLPSIVAELDRVAAVTEAAVAGLDDLGTTVQLPKAPWLPTDPAGFPPSGSCCTSSKNWPGTRGTPTSSGSRSTAPRCMS